MDKTKMIAVPSESFKTVRDLMKEEKLTRTEKIKALYNWKSTCEELDTSTNEGMPGDRPNPLREVLQGLRELGVNLT